MAMTLDEYMLGFGPGAEADWWEDVGALAPEDVRISRLRDKPKSSAITLVLYAAAGIVGGYAVLRALGKV